eukprot:CAMPEP_0168525296 /NCGR_PEP_ID=MMETSP0405-20121227/11210_1 /TAXON_ID=498012 /ORGANISM="Trichosphaerium sp, Strain Am-I-7 wt" /LENGTH=211 /DNA_ID=CAMNT_0008547765 /DNA_START=74 /DNA_END=706 /DNA_ORIENTATION=-
MSNSWNMELYKSDENADDVKAFIKLNLVGDAGVGKTCLLQRYVNDTFMEAYKATIGSDFLCTNITVEDKSYTLQLWDTAGQERFQSLGKHFYRGSDCGILVYDVTNAKSFENLERWRNEFLLRANVTDPTQFPFAVIGNKVDRVTERKVPESKARDWCDRCGFDYFETSAMDAVGVKSAFQKIVELMPKPSNLVVSKDSDVIKELSKPVVT